MMVGLQGAGKTTHCGKLAGMFKKQGKRPLLVACDVYRPAAIKQLQIVGEKIDVPVFCIEDSKDPVEIAKTGVEFAKKHGNDMVFIDTAGRLQIDETLMNELSSIKESVNPTEIILVVDAMTGQDAVNIASGFNDQLDITGVLLTKMDGDTRGGAALSVKYVTGKPIKFIGVGEKLDTIEPFYPDRMASRILGMGDVLTLIEKAEQAFDEKQALEIANKIKNDDFNLNDFLEQFQQMKKMGSMEDILRMMPGVNADQLKNVEFDKKATGKMEAIIYSMTPKERRKPELLNASRKKRIAAGSGTSVQEVNRLLKQFEQSRQLMKQFTGKGKKRRGLMSALFGKRGF
jgi:signal recognition particle subunit SRP54